MAVTTTTVTGTLVDPSNTADSTGYVVFTLLGYGSSLPRVLGAVILTTQTKATADNTGAFSVNIISNDTIDPSTTFYQVDFYSVIGVHLYTEYFLITGATLDLDSATPYTPPGPSPTPPPLPSVTLNVTTTVVGNFMVAHTLGRVPVAADIMMTSGGNIWFQSTKFDANDLYLVSGAVGLTATIVLW